MTWPRNWTVDPTSDEAVPEFRSLKEKDSMAPHMRPSHGLSILALGEKRARPTKRGTFKPKDV